MFPKFIATALQFFSSDHSPFVLKLWTAKELQGSKPFRFSNLWTTNSDYHRIMNHILKFSRSGNMLFHIVSMLKIARDNLRN